MSSHSTLSPTPQQLEAVLDSPALPPPPGVVPNFEDDYNSRTISLSIKLIPLIIASLAIGMRVYTKKFLMRKFDLSDYTILLGWVLWAAIIIPSALVIRDVGSGKHQWELRVRDTIRYLYLYFIAEILTALSMMLIKVSIFLQYLQIFVPKGRRTPMFWSCHVLIWIIVAFYVTGTFVVIFQCNPVEKAWNKTITTGHCLASDWLNLAASVVNSVSDLVMLILPQTSIWRLQMTFKKKAMISTVFSFGLFACACSIIRIVYAVPVATSLDKMYHLWRFGNWMYPEVAAGIVAACLPCSGRFAKRLNETWIFRELGSSVASLFRSSKASRATDSDTGIFVDGPYSGSIDWKAHHKNHWMKSTDGYRMTVEDKGSLVATEPSQKSSYGESTILRTTNIAMVVEANPWSTNMDYGR